MALNKERRIAPGKSVLVPVESGPEGRKAYTMRTFVAGQEDELQPLLTEQQLAHLRGKGVLEGQWEPGVNPADEEKQKRAEKAQKAADLWESQEAEAPAEDKDAAPRLSTSEEEAARQEAEAGAEKPHRGRRGHAKEE